MGDPDGGIAYYGNLYYEGFGMQQERSVVGVMLDPKAREDGRGQCRRARRSHGGATSAQSRPPGMRLRFPLPSAALCPSQDSVFIVNMPRAILGHPTVLVHELTHAFHHRVGWCADMIGIHFEWSA